jgi:glycosyltransferase involved in cell wall biosynthesis
MVSGISVRRYRLPLEGSGALSYIAEYLTVTLSSFFLSLALRFRGRIDVVHIHNPPDTMGLVARALQLLGARFVYDHHDLAPELYRARFGARARPSVHRVLLQLERWCCRWADHVITTNESYRAIELQRDGLEASDITIVRNGPQAEKFRSAVADDSVREGAPILVCYAGAIGPQDGVDYLVRAMGELVHTLGRKDVCCHVLGDGDALPQVKALVGDLEITDAMRFTGWLNGSQYLSHLAAADICVEPAPSSPYNERSTTIKILEYMALGKPIVAFDLTEHRVSAADAALYVTPNDSRAFANAIAELADDEPARTKMGLVGQERIETKLSWSHSAPALLSVYNDLAAAVDR